MTTANAYILNVPNRRREILLQGEKAAEPVPVFSHNRQAPLVVFASFEDKQITHIADGRKGLYAGTGLVRLNMNNLQILNRSISFDEIEAGIEGKIRPHLRRVLASGGLLPPAVRHAVVDRIVALDKSLRNRLLRFSALRSNALGRLKNQERHNLALQKESLGIALGIAGFTKKELLDWTLPSKDKNRCFLDGLPKVQMREDEMLLGDFLSVPGFKAINDDTDHCAVRTFKKPNDRLPRLTVIMANRLPLEQQTGADLIYFNETYRSFVMVQCKAMEQGQNGAEFRWTQEDQFEREILRMDSMVAKLNKEKSGTSPDGYRFSENPFFLKFCPRVRFNPDDKSLSKGIYLPLDLWRRNHIAGRLKGKRGGNLLTFENVGRRITNSEFISLVTNSWVGTSIEQSGHLENWIRGVLVSGKSITFAIKHSAPFLPVS